MLAWQELNLLLMTTADIPSSCQEMYLLPHTAIFYITYVCLYAYTYMHTQSKNSSATNNKSSESNI